MHLLIKFLIVSVCKFITVAGIDDTGNLQVHNQD